MVVIPEQPTIIEVLSKFNGVRKADTIHVSDLTKLQSPTPVKEITVPDTLHPEIESGKTSTRQVLYIKASDTDIILPSIFADFRYIVEAAAEVHYEGKGYSTNDYAQIDFRQGYVEPEKTLDTFDIHGDSYLVDLDGNHIETDSYAISNILDISLYRTPIEFSDEEIKCLNRSARVRWFDGRLEYNAVLNEIFCRKAVNGEIEPVRFGKNMLVNFQALAPHRSTLNQSGETVLRTSIVTRFLPKMPKGGTFVSNPVLEGLSQNFS